MHNTHAAMHYSFINITNALKTINFCTPAKKKKKAHVFLANKMKKINKCQLIFDYATIKCNVWHYNDQPHIACQCRFLFTKHNK